MRFRILNRQEARAQLTQEDTYFQNISADSLELLRARDSHDLRNITGGQVKDFSQNERILVEAHMNDLLQRMEQLGLNFDVEVLVAKTSGRESGGMAYTRGNTIVIPETMFGMMGEMMRRQTGVGLDMGLMAHEVFHVLSRTRTDEDRDANLYPIWGFYRHDFDNYPQGILTNPDAPNHNYAVMVEQNGQELLVTPILRVPQGPQDLPDADKMLWDGQNFHHRNSTNYMEVTNAPTPVSAYHPEEMSAQAFMLWMRDEQFNQSEAFENVVRSWLPDDN